MDEQADDDREHDPAFTLLPEGDADRSPFHRQPRQGPPLVLALVVPFQHPDPEVVPADRNAAGGVDLLDGEPGAVPHGGALGGGPAGEGPGQGDQQGVPGPEGKGGEGQGQGE